MLRRGQGSPTVPVPPHYEPLRALSCRTGRTNASPRHSRSIRIRRREVREKEKEKGKCHAEDPDVLHRNEGCWRHRFRRCELLFQREKTTLPPKQIAKQGSKQGGAALPSSRPRQSAVSHREQVTAFRGALRDNLLGLVTLTVTGLFLLEVQK